MEANKYYSTILYQNGKIEKERRKTMPLGNLLHNPHAISLKCKFILRKKGEIYSRISPF